MDYDDYIFTQKILEKLFVVFWKKQNSAQLRLCSAWMSLCWGEFCLRVGVFLGISSSWVNLRLNTENQLSKLLERTLKVCVGGGGC